MLDSMHKIKHISALILKEKTSDIVVTASDTEAKRDIMSLLVRARKVDLEKDAAVYTMSDKAMMDQVVKSTQTMRAIILVLMCSAS